jgi:SAM-dependent methyltransferase
MSPEPIRNLVRQALRRAYRASARDVVSAARARLARTTTASPSRSDATPPSEAFLRSSEYAELMSRDLPYDGSHDLHEAQNETRNYRFRHQTVAKRLGVFRWRGIQKHLDTILRLVTAPGSKVIDFGGAGGPLGFCAEVVDQLSVDAWGRAVPYSSLADVGDDVDVVFSSHALEHIPELDETLLAIQRCLKSGGDLVLHLPSFHCERWRAGVHTSRPFNDHVWTFGIDRDPVGVQCQSYVDIAAKVREQFDLRCAEYCGDDSILILARKR